MKDYYQILGIARDASKDDIKKAYRDLAHKYHPDKKGGNEARFKEINEAYHTLADDQKRAQYDRFGKTFDQTAWGGDFSGWPGFEDLGSNMHEIFEDFFGFGMGGTRGGAGAKRGRDIALDVEVSFEEAIFGTHRRVLLRKLAVCEICKGSGVAPGAKEHTCTRCQGSGTIHSTKKSLFGSITRLSECTACHGRGKIPEKKCTACGGVGTLPQSGEVSIEIPAGIQDGEMVRLEGEGEAPPTVIGRSEPGDLYVRIHVRPHKTLRRVGRDLVMKLDIPLTEALLGGEREIETLDGPISIKIPAGILEGETLSVRGKGVPVSGRGGFAAQGRGDLLIEVHVRYPRRLSEHAKKLITELRNEGL
jgi:molecular chaperone DnaJ